MGNNENRIDNIKLTKDLWEMAKAMGACDKVMNSWNCKTLSLRELIELWKNNVEFAVYKDYPSLEYIRSLNITEELHKANVYLDERIAEDNIDGTIMCLGDTKGIICEDEYSVATIHVRHNSNVVIVGKSLSKVWVDLYDNAQVEIIQDDAASVYLITHGNLCKYTTEGNVSVRNK